MCEDPQTKNMDGPPVDLSFHDITFLTGALSKKPRIGRRPLKMNSEEKYLSRCLRLNNNSIFNLGGLQYIVNSLLAQPSMLGWLDLSFNEISCIDPVLCELHELRVLYLHGNGIWMLSDVDKLRTLQHLRTITLHGNDIEKQKNYSSVIFALPQLKTLDFSVVTPAERRLANIWRPCSNRGKTPWSLG
ncbi:leucine-rich repeat-containing protein 51-like isoform X2 [Sebastes fasciatus]|uniref:leucine-rich repeat-containing protein 51-like isoform X2 n=1 Tax=Sebastes fasciatus TaxID=394691 RepID=UPI003D9F36D9